MEETKVLLESMMTERQIIGGLITKHNELARAHQRLVYKHNALCKTIKGVCLVSLGLELLIFMNACEISKLKAELKKEKEDKEG